VLPDLAAEYTVVAPDRRGMSDSATPRAGYDSDTVATDVRELVDRLGYDPAAVVGHDWVMPAA
jgi:pimeloyl-ACP methyl ester carboxylesterase